jgi:hypothetical protein
LGNSGKKNSIKGLITIVGDSSSSMNLQNFDENVIFETQE